MFIIGSTQCLHSQFYLHLAVKTALQIMPEVTKCLSLPRTPIILTHEGGRIEANKNEYKDESL